MTNNDVEAAIEGARSLQDSVNDLTAVLLMSSERQASRWRTTTLLLLALVLIGLVGGWTLTARVDRGVKCLNQEMADHRNDNRISHDILAAKHDVSIPIAGGLPDPQPLAEIKRLCAPFYRGR